MLLILVGTVTLHHYRVKGAVERYKAELEAKGQPIRWTDVVLPPLDPKENSAALLLRLSARLPQNGPLTTNYSTGMQMIDAGKAMADWAQPWVGDLGMSNSWPQVLADYEAQRALIAEFHQLIDKPNIDHNLDYSQGFSLLLPHLSSSKSRVQRLGAASICELHLGNPKEAILHARTMVAMAQAGRREPLLISQLVNIAIASIAASTTWDVLQASKLDERDLAALQQDWSRLEFYSPMEKALLMERCLSLQTIQLMRESPDEFRNVTSWMASGVSQVGGSSTPRGGLLGSVRWIAELAWDRTRDGLAEGAWHTSWSYTDELGMLKGNEALLEVVRLAITNGFASNALGLLEEMKGDQRIPSSSGNYSEGSSEWSALQSMFSDSVESCDKALNKAFRAQAIARLVTVAIALQRCRLRNNNYPDTLSELLPEYMTSTPRDPVDGKPLRYRRLSRQLYLLYSIGDDLKDDGGDPNRPGQSATSSSHYLGSGRDWVWPQPASKQDVQAYWEREIDANYDQVFQPEKEIDPYTGKPIEETKPALYPPTDGPRVDPETGAALVALEVNESPTQRTERIEALAREWTEDYFHTLTNGTADLTAP